MKFAKKGFKKTAGFTFPSVTREPAIFSQTPVTTVQMTIVSFPTSQTSIGLRGDI